jgi:choline dehydrogenase-like flavoprotein
LTPSASEGPSARSGGSPSPPAPRGWSTRELATLALVFETIAPGDGVRRASLAAAALGATSEPDDLLQLRLALRLLDSPAANRASGLPRRSFGGLSPQERERLLLRWAMSQLGRRRTAFQALKRLGAFFAYADPGPTGRNLNWERIGYRPVEEPVTPEPPALQPLADDGGTGTLELEADVVVVGSGAGGGVAAARLAEAGRAVLVVEAGAFVPETAFSPYELDGFDRLYLDHGLTATADLGIAILAGGTLGGGTTVNWMTCLEPPPALRQRWAREHGLEGLDGAPADAELARLRVELGLELAHAIPAKDRLVLEGAHALGWRSALVRRNASACGDCGACGFGCRRGARHSGPRLHLAWAARDGARVLVRATVERVDVQAGRAVGVQGEVVRADGGRRPFRARAPQVVVAAGALRTPLVLRRSGVAHPALGEYLRLHPVPVVAARLAEPVEMWHGPTQAASSDEFARPGPAAPEGPGPAHGGFLIETAPGHPGLIALAFPWEGRAAAAHLMAAIRYFAPLIAIVADRDHGRVGLSRHGRARVEYRISRRDADSARRALVEMARLARAGGAEAMLALGTPPAGFDLAGGRASPQAWRAYLEQLARFDFRPNRGTLFSAHQMGTARAGREPGSHPCDPQGRVRADRLGIVVRGLYVADTSLFPTAAGVNPMVSAMLLAASTARTVLAEA